MSLFTDLNDTKTILNWTGTVLTETITGKSYRNTFQREQEFALLVAVNVITENGITGLYPEDVLDIAYHIGRTAEGEVMNGDFKKAYSVMKETAENMLFFAPDVMDKRKRSKKESGIEGKESD
jgi:nitrogen regulatory protein PII-like uncharacterized protein